MNDFYVYLYLREDGTPYYVGKGKNNRAFLSSGRRMKSKPPSDKSRIVIHSKNLTEEEAFALEMKLIAEYGRIDKDTGILENLTAGGDGFKSMYFTDELKAQWSKAAKAKNARPEVRAKLSVASKKYYSNPEVKAKHSEIMKEVTNRPEVKTKLSKIRKEIFNTPDAKDIRSASAKNRWSNPELRTKMSAIQKESYKNRPEQRTKHSAAMKAIHAKKKLERFTSTANLEPFFMST